MIVIVGLVVLIFAVIVGFTGVLNNAGPLHRLSENFSVLGYHVTGSTGTLFLFGIVVGGLAMLGVSVLLAGARRTAARGRDARSELKRFHRERAFVNRDQDFGHQPVDQATGFTADSESATTRPRRKWGSLLGRRRSYGRQPTAAVGGQRHDYTDVPQPRS